jgi:hypothetical protein
MASDGFRNRRFGNGRRVRGESETKKRNGAQSMSERIERVFFVVLGVFVLTLGAWSYYLVYRVQKDKAEINAYQTQIEQLQYESEQQERRFDESRKRAAYAMQHVKDETSRLLSAKVPKDCAKAMDWGRRAAQAFR